MSRDTSTKQAIAERLRLAREQAGLSQGQVAKMLDLHRPSVSEAEAGRRNVSAEELAKLADIYGVDIAWLTCRESEEDDADQSRVHLAAREMAKLKPQDLDRVMKLLKALRVHGGKRS